jgi:hypothetical protein
MPPSASMCSKRRVKPLDMPKSRRATWMWVEGSMSGQSQGDSRMRVRVRERERERGA